MPKILYIKEGITKGRITLGIEHDGECRGYSVSIATYLALGSPVKFCSISDADLGTAAYEDECLRAMKKAVSLLSMSDKSVHTLESKLIHAGFKKDIARHTAEECMARGYIDEGRQLDRLCEKEANISLRGRHYIKRKLMSKGYRSSEIDAALDRLTDGGIVDFKENLLRLYEKKSATQDEEKRAIRYKYGYSTEDFDT